MFIRWEPRATDTAASGWRRWKRRETWHCGAQASNARGRERTSDPACEWIRETRAVVDGSTSGSKCSAIGCRVQRRTCPTVRRRTVSILFSRPSRRARLSCATTTPWTYAHASSSMLHLSVLRENVHSPSSRPRLNLIVPGFSDGSTWFLGSSPRTVRETSETSLTRAQPTIRNVRETQPNRSESHPGRENILSTSFLACFEADHDTTRGPARAARAAKTWKRNRTCWSVLVKREKIQDQ